MGAARAAIVAATAVAVAASAEEKIGASVEVVAAEVAAAAVVVEVVVADAEDRSRMDGRRVGNSLKDLMPTVAVCADRMT